MQYIQRIGSGIETGEGKIDQIRVKRRNALYLMCASVIQSRDGPDFFPRSELTGQKKQVRSYLEY